MASPRFACSFLVCKLYQLYTNYVKDIITGHAKHMVAFSGEDTWKKKDIDSELFDVATGSFDGEGTCKLVVCYIVAISSFTQIRYIIGLYRDLLYFQNAKRVLNRAERTSFNQITRVG